MVSKVNINSRSVTVEWHEHGETKGKEVELDAILQLNAELQEQAASLPKIVKQNSSNPLSRVSFIKNTNTAFIKKKLFCLFYRKFLFIYFSNSFYEINIRNVLLLKYTDIKQFYFSIGKHNYFYFMHIFNTMF